MPALLTRMSTPPSSASVRPTAVSTEVGSETSTASGSAVPPAAATRPATRSARSGSRSAQATAAPAPASAVQIASPSPPPPPVTKATRPVSEKASRLMAPSGPPATPERRDLSAPSDSLLRATEGRDTLLHGGLRAVRRSRPAACNSLSREGAGWPQGTRSRTHHLRQDVLRRHGLAVLGRPVGSLAQRHRPQRHVAGDLRLGVLLDRPHQLAHRALERLREPALLPGRRLPAAVHRPRRPRDRGRAPRGVVGPADRPLGDALRPLDPPLDPLVGPRV